MSTVEQLEVKALLSTLFVDGSNHTGVEDGSQTHPYSHIQAAINKSATGDTVNVAAGVYAETLTINHALKLNGPNAGVNPNTGTRGAEAVVIPAANNPSSGRMILVTGNNVTIDGLTIDGHNAALSGGQTLNGVSSNAASGVTNVDSTGKIAVISGLHVQNDVIQNLTAFGVMADINDFSTSTLAVSTGNTISNNRIDNLPVVSPVPGRGISIEDNFYADVTGNVITRAGTGIQAIFMLNPNPGATTSTISGNTIHDYALGIYLWTFDSDAPAFTVNNNTIVTENDPQTIPGNAGIELDRILNTSAVSLSGNNVSGAHAGIELQYTSVSPTVTVTGGTLAGNDYGVLATNSDRPSSDNPAKAVKANLTGVTITGSKLAAMDVVDALGTSSSSVTLNVDASTSLSGNAHGAVLSGTGAHLVETVKPVVTLTSTPAVQTADTTASFGFTATDNITTANDLLVQYKLDGGTLTTAAASPLNFSGLAVGAHTLAMTATDQVGNATTVTYSWTVTNGPPPPPAPSTPVLDAASDTGASSTDGITRDGTPTFTGNAPAGSTVTLFAGTTTLGTTTAGSDGLWTFTVGGTGALVATLADGSYAITATENNGSATSPPSGTLALVVDDAPPSASLTNKPPAQTTSGVASFTFTAADNTTAAASLVSQYSLDGGAPAAAASPINLSGLAVGSHTFILTTTDLAGNASTTTYQWSIIAGASTLYVNSSNLTGVEDGTQAHPFSHIQAAINASAAGDTVSVAPGVYAESLTIPHALSLVGPNAGVNPNTGTRGAEAVLIPDVNNPNSGRMILVAGSNVTIDGLTIDGHNAALTGGQLLNGISSNSSSGIATVDSTGKVYVVSGLTVQNDIIRNLTAFGFIGDINDFSTPTLAVSTGNVIRDNNIDNIPVVSPTPGRGISIEHNFYADVIDNVITRAGTGIQAIFMLDPNPSPNPSVISGNIVHDYALGIYLWTIDSDEPAFTVSNNTIITENDPQTAANNAGIELDRILHTSAVSLSGNNVSGAHAGIELQYTSVSPTVTVTGGTLAGNDYGVLITNSDVPPGDVPPKPVQGSLSGVTITGSKLAALDIEDALAAAGATVTLNVDASTSLANNPHGAVLQGPNAKLLESVLPVITLTATPPAQTTATTASFGFTATDNITTANDLLVQYKLDGGTLTTAAASPLNFSGLAVGAHTLALTATDQVGNATTVTYSWTVTNGPPPPPAPSTPTLDTASDTGASSTDGITRDSTPTFTGNAPAGSTVTLLDGTNVLGTTTADSGGQWTFTVGGTGSLVATLADGSHPISATDTDAASNTSLPSATRSVVIDNAPPSLTLTGTPPAQTTSASASFAFNTADNVTASGNLLIQYSLDGGAFLTATSPVNLSGLAVGTHTFVLTSTDLAGNATTVSYPWTVATTPPPAAPSTPTLDAASDTGSSNRDGITRDNTPTFTGTAPAGTTVNLFAGTTPLGSTTAASNGQWSFTVGGPGVVVASLADGSYAITATAQNGSASSQPSGSRSLVVDTTAPVIQTGRSPQPNSAGWNNANVQASYTASDAGSGLTSSSVGSYTFSAQGAGQSHVFTVTDVAGNSASATVGSVNIDKTAPAITAASSPSALASSSGGQSTVTISGRVTDTLSGPAAGLTYSVKDSYGQFSKTGTASVGTGGNYSFALAVPTTLNSRRTTRTYTITVTGNDAAGNAKSVTTTVSVRFGILVIQKQSTAKPKATHPAPKVTHAVPKPPAHPKRWK